MVDDLHLQVRHPRILAGAAALAAGALSVVGCHNPGDPTSPDPVRFLVEGRTPCRIVFGPATGVEEVASITTPDGPVRIEIGTFGAHDERPATNTVVDGIRVRLTETSASWDFPPTYVVVESDGVDLEPLLPELLDAAGASNMAQVFVERIEGADVEFAGLANAPDVTVTYGDGSTSSFNGRENRTEPEGEQVDAATFAAEVERLLTADDGCGPGGAAPRVEAARTIESDIGSLLEVEPATRALRIGSVELTDADDGRFPATLSHAEAQLLSDALSPPPG